jgi:hypothetical protein
METFQHTPFMKGTCKGMQEEVLQTPNCILTLMSRCLVRPCKICNKKVNPLEIKRCNQKERVRDHTVLWLPARPLAPLCFLIFCTRFTPPNHTTPDSLLILTDVPCKTRDTQMLCFHITTAQNSHKYQPRRFFHYKLHTLPESTSMIPIKVLTNQQTSSFVLCVCVCVCVSLILLQQLGQSLGAAKKL